MAGAASRMTRRQPPQQCPLEGQERKKTMFLRWRTHRLTQGDLAHHAQVVEAWRQPPESRVRQRVLGYLGAWRDRDSDDPRAQAAFWGGGGATTQGPRPAG